MNNPFQWPDGTPRSQFNAFNWSGKTSYIAARLQREKITSVNSSKLVDEKKVSTITYSKAGKK